MLIIITYVFLETINTTNFNLLPFKLENRDLVENKT